MKSVRLTGRALVVALLCLLAAQAESAEGLRRQSIIDVSWDNGGNLITYAQNVSRLRKRDAQVRLSGSCASACTLYLTLPTSQVCIRPGASFAFHRAHSASADVNRWGTRYLMDRYPDWVRRWIASRGGLSDQVIWMGYDYAAKFLRSCETA